MASKDEYKSEYSEELTNFIETPAAPAPAPESTEFGVRSTAVSLPLLLACQCPANLTVTVPSYQERSPPRRRRW